MRKRSCSIHSQSLQGFLQLTDLAEKRTGIFYDSPLQNVLQKAGDGRRQRSSEKLGKIHEYMVQMNDEKQIRTKTFLLENFQYEAQTHQYEQDLKKVQQEAYEGYVRHNIGILSSGNQSDVRECFGRLLNQTRSTEEKNPLPDDLAAERKIDLVRKTLKTGSSRSSGYISQIGLNIWLIDLEQIFCPIIRSYLNILDTTFILHEETIPQDLERKNTKTYKLEHLDKEQCLAKIIKDLQQDFNVPLTI